MSTHAVQTDNGRSRSPARTGTGTETDNQRAMTPRVDVSEDDTGITLLADLPGVAREQLELRVEADTLHLEATLDAATPGDLQAAYAEVRLPRYRRAFTLSRELDASHIEAQLKDGVLKLRIPKQAHAQPRRIEIAAG